MSVVFDYQGVTSETLPNHNGEGRKTLTSLVFQIGGADQMFTQSLNASRKVQAEVAEAQQAAGEKPSDRAREADRYRKDLEDVDKRLSDASDKAVKLEDQLAQAVRGSQHDKADEVEAHLASVRGQIMALQVRRRLVEDLLRSSEHALAAERWAAQEQARRAIEQRLESEYLRLKSEFEAAVAERFAALDVAFSALESSRGRPIPEPVPEYRPSPESQAIATEVKRKAGLIERLSSIGIGNRHREAYGA